MPLARRGRLRPCGIPGASTSGRVREEDWRVVPAVFGSGAGSARRTACSLSLPNLQGEFKDEADAGADARGRMVS